MKDREIIELLFGRQEKGLEEAQLAYGHLCHSIAYNVLGSHEDAVECVNDTLLGIWNAIPPQRPDNLKAFISRIARNQALKRLEKQSSRKRGGEMTVSLTELEGVLPDERISPDISDKELGELISRFLRGEKESARRVFVRKYWFFDSLEDISKRYGFSVSKVKSMLYHTRAKLKKFLIKEGIEI